MFIPLEDRAAQPQTACVAVSAPRRPLPRIARLVADLLAAQAQEVLAQVRAAQAARGKPRRRARAT